MIRTTTYEILNCPLFGNWWNDSAISFASVGKRLAVLFERTSGGNMSAIGSVYPAQIVVIQAEVRLVADQTANANTETIKSDQQRVATAQEVEAAEANTSSVDFVT
jgi:hypothetical protein